MALDPAAIAVGLGCAVAGAGVGEAVRKVFHDRERFASQSIREEVAAIIRPLEDQIRAVTETLNSMRRDDAGQHEWRGVVDKRLGDHDGYISKNAEEIYQLRTDTHLLANALQKVEPTFRLPRKRE